jgi:hypothetical protein
MTTDQHLPETTTAGAAADLHAEHLTALADNALALTQTTGLTRRDLLLARAQVWEVIASTGAPILAAVPARSDQRGPQGLSVFEVPLVNVVSSLRGRCSPILRESEMALRGTVADVVIAPVVVLCNGVHDS